MGNILLGEAVGQKNKARFEEDLGSSHKNQQWVEGSGHMEGSEYIRREMGEVAAAALVGVHMAWDGPVDLVRILG